MSLTRACTACRAAFAFSPAPRTLSTLASAPVSASAAATPLRVMRRGAIALQVLRPPKGATRDAASQRERALRIQANLAPGVQAKKLADYKKTLAAKPRSGGLLQYIKKNAWEKD